MSQNSKANFRTVRSRRSLHGVLDRDQRRIVKAIVRGARYEQVMDVVAATIGHHVYEYVKVEILIDIIAAMAKRPNAEVSEVAVAGSTKTSGGRTPLSLD